MVNIIELFGIDFILATLCPYTNRDMLFVKNPVLTANDYQLIDRLY